MNSGFICQLSKFIYMNFCCCLLEIQIAVGKANFFCRKGSSLALKTCVKPLDDIREPVG